MFSIRYPQILSHLGQLAYGLQPVHIRADARFALIIKVSKEAILTARLNQQIRVYLIPDAANANRSHGFITAFFDDHDEPLVVFTPLYEGDAMLNDLTSTLGQDYFDLYFFDEHDREMMGVRACTSDLERFRATMRDTSFRTFQANEVASTLEMMQHWFARRTKHDDERAFIVSFDGTLYPDDFVIIDARPEAYDFHGSSDRPAMTQLERHEPGTFQERDIARLMQRAFSGEAIYLNPIRDDNGTELSDVLCVTDGVVLLVQAKDSPNTEESLRRSMHRKRAIIRAHIKKGAKQLQGALSYIKERNEVVLREAGGRRVVSIGGRKICGLVVVRELFDDDYEACSAPVLSVAKACSEPCVLIDYAAMHLMALYLASPIGLCNGLFRMFGLALELGQFPKPRFTGAPSGKADAGRQ